MRTSALVLLSVLFSFSTKAQTGYKIRGKSLVELRQEQSYRPAAVQGLFPPPITPLLLKDQKSSTLLTASSKSYSPPLVYCYEDLAFFCRLEVRMEKASRIPVKFRLGEVQYTERMEGKYE